MYLGSFFCCTSKDSSDKIRWLVLTENIVSMENSQLTQNWKKQGILPFQSELEKLTNLYGQNVHGCDVANTEGETITQQTG